MQIYYEVEPQERFDPMRIIEDAANCKARTLLFNEGILPEAFFDLSKGVAGELLNKTATYRLRLACVVPDLSPYSSQFQAFVREANQGGEIKFFSSREEALQWLEEGSNQDS
jgi:hypothetical protein